MCQELNLDFSTTMRFLSWVCTRRKIEQFRCRKKSEMVWKWSVYGELCLYIVGGCGHILQNTSINTISPDLTLIYDAENGNKQLHNKINNANKNLPIGKQRKQQRICHGTATNCVGGWSPPVHPVATFNEAESIVTFE